MFPGPQSLRGTRPIETAPIAALPINVSTTRRERFMVAILSVATAWTIPSFHHLCAQKQAKADPFTASCGGMYQPPENPKACANEPKPPRVTPLEEALEVPDAAWLDEESLE